jgi:hypothetical protein
VAAQAVAADDWAAASEPLWPLNGPTRLPAGTTAMLSTMPVIPNGRGSPAAGERRFRAVGRRTQRVESEDGDARGGADALPGFFPVGERLAEQQVEEGHLSM